MKQLRCGDKVIIAALAAVVAYEKLVSDDEDLISRRVAAYRKRVPVLVDLAVLVTAGHLCEKLPPGLDPYVWLMKWFRVCDAAKSTPPQLSTQH